MKNLKKLIVFVLALSLLLSSLTMSIYAYEINYGDNGNSKNDISPCSDMPDKHSNNS